MEKIIIIGGVAAGATAAAKARRLSPDAQITILEAGADISFANCGLPYYIGGDIKTRSKLILQSPESFKDQYQADVHLYTKATEIDRENRMVHTEDTLSGHKKSFEYTKLILAQGGKPIAPPLPGAGQDHVFQLWTLDDMDKIDAFITENEPKTAVVVGGGFIGLEMIEALAKRGMKVSVVEMMPHVMGIMEAEIAGFIQEELMSYGIDLFTDKAVTEVGDNTVNLNDGTTVKADMVLMSIGVRPTLTLAKEAGLELGSAGGLLVDSTLKTSDDNIYAAGDMIELEHRVLGKKVRIPLAGPANRQGRLAAENALGQKHEYKGSIGTSIVRVFEAVAGITGLSLSAARAEGLDADAVVVHKEHHTSYYPGAQMVTIQIVYDKKTGQVLGGQTAGYEGADRRLDVLATAVAAKLTVSDLSDIDIAYSPPLGNANDGLNMAAFAAENRISGYSPSLTVVELDEFLEGKNPIWIDVRDVFSFKKAHVESASNVPLEFLPKVFDQIPKNHLIVVYDNTGKKGHQALRTLHGAGFDQAINVSGGFISLSNYSRSVTPKHFTLQLPKLELKTIGEDVESDTSASNDSTNLNESTGPLVIDVRTSEEFSYGASGARSGYAMQILNSFNFTNLENGGSLNRMMSRNI